MKKEWAYPDARRFEVKEFDLLKEGTLSFVILTIVVLVIAAVAGAPYRPAVTNADIATKDPVLFQKTALGYIDGSEDIATYGPPYNNGWHGNVTGVQSLGGFAPQTWWGTPYPVNAARDFVLSPLAKLATASGNSSLQNALNTYESASYAQQMTWNKNYRDALTKATVNGNQVTVPQGDYGPVQQMMQSELRFAQTGLLSGALAAQTNQGVYRWNVQNDLLFLQGDPLHQIAGNINMKGEQWGINHDEQAYPGPWWLTPYTFLYQVPPWSTASNADQLAAYTVAVLFLLLIFLPWIPGLRSIPRLLPVYRFIWRDWYRMQNRSGGGGGVSGTDNRTSFGTGTRSGGRSHA
ncbi:hypothetical protein LLE49_22685 [Alicyclobacillus tolerans]|uniref:hypothetical protein n=1 Tax=Alicyclobacillus tolerans TaxID=90970 RepID=UPI001F34A75B|nr:hypothetical protein [Alicyclobacillus tolerans]MCF8567531.1 hypothetical protein [Alicyclobacillus tolerans]